MKQHNRSSGHGFQRIEHTGEIYAARIGVVVRVVIDDEAGGFEQRPVVLPAGVADVDLRIRRKTLEEICTEFEGACAAQRLRGDRALGSDDLAVCTKHQFLNRLVVSGETFDGEVGAWRRFLHQCRFGLLYTLQQRYLAVVIVINPYAKIGFVGILVGVESLGDPKNRIAGCHLNSCEQGCG